MLEYCTALRDPNWHTAEIYGILHRHKAAFCIFEIAGAFSGLQIATDFTYIRLHGPGAAYQGSYPETTLREWAGRIREWQKKLRAVYLYFDNDQEACAAHNALALKRLVAL
jgi:uncharacterized protein YecE (DUF72 family)